MRTTVSGGLAFFVAVCVLPQDTLAGTSTAFVRKGGEIVVATTSLRSDQFMVIHDTTALPNDGFVIVWEEGEEELLDSTSALRAVWVDSGGRVVAEALVGDSAEPGYNLRAASASIANGLVLISWEKSFHFRPRSVQGRYFDEYGAPLSDELTFFETLPPDTSGVSRWIDVAAIDSDQFIVTWESLTPQDASRVAGRTVSLDGPNNPPFVFHAETDQYRPQVASSGGGEFVVAWADHGQVQVEGGGETPFPARQVASVESATDGPTIPALCAGGGQFVVAWLARESRDVTRYWYRRHAPDGEPIEDARPLAPQDQTFFLSSVPSIDCLEDRSFAATWSLPDGTHHGRVIAEDRTSRFRRLPTSPIQGRSLVRRLSSNDLVVSWWECSLSPKDCTIRAQVYGEGIPSCIGDCGGDGIVDISELVTGVGIALSPDVASVRECFPFDADLDYSVRIHELVAAVSNALRGCA